MQTRTDTPVQSSSVPITVDVAGTSNTKGLTLYIGIAVLGMLLILIIGLVILLTAILLSPRKTHRKLNQVKSAPEPNSVGYEHYTDVTDAPAIVGHPEPVFDDPVYHAPTPKKRQDSHSKIMDISTRQTQVAEAEDVTAYAVSNVHSTTSNSLSSIQEQNSGNEYAEP